MTAPKTLRCPMCGRMRQSLTRDHILPRCRGALHFLASKGSPHRNVRKICGECNTLRAAAGHCDAILACARAIASARRSSVQNILREWGFKRAKGASAQPLRKAVLASLECRA